MSLRPTSEERLELVNFSLDLAHEFSEGEPDADKVNLIFDALYSFYEKKIDVLAEKKAHTALSDYKSSAKKEALAELHAERDSLLREIKRLKKNIEVPHTNTGIVTVDGNYHDDSVQATVAAHYASSRSHYAVENIHLVREMTVRQNDISLIGLEQIEGRLLTEFLPHLKKYSSLTIQQSGSMHPDTCKVEMHVALPLLNDLSDTDKFHYLGSLPRNKI